MMGQGVSQDELDDLFESLANSNGKMEFPEFLAVTAHHMISYTPR